MSNKRLSERISKIVNVDYADEDIAMVNDVRKLPFGRDDNLFKDYIVLLFVREGYMHITIDGEIHSISDTQILVCRPGHHMTNPSYSDNFSGHALILSMRYGQSIISVTGNIWNYLMSIDSSPVIDIPRESRKCLLAYYHLIFIEVRRTDNIYHREVVSSILKAMLYSFISDMRNRVRLSQMSVPDMSTTFSGSTQAVSLFHRFIDIIINEHCVERKIDYYAERLCVTSKYLSTVCKQVSNRTAHEWICDTIVNGINNYLRFTDKTIKEISVIYGFTTLSFFSKFVKEHLGQSPSAIRKQSAGSQDNQ